MTNEKLSEWLDGELDADDSRQIVQDLSRHAGQRETCELYWMIGDCLRGESAAQGDVTARVMAALADEPTVLAPVRRPQPAVRQANRWMPMAAAVAGFAVAVWMGLSLWSQPSLTAPAAVAQNTVVIATPPQVASSGVQAEALADERDYLMAHQASSMGAPMAGVAQYIRTVSAEQAAGR